MNTNDLYWLAGLIDGEGCFIAHSSHRGKYPLRQVRISLEMCDQDVVERVKVITGTTSNVTLRNSRPNRNHRPRYTVHLNGTRAIQWALTMYPIMGERRKAAIVKMVNLWKQSPARSLRKKHLTHGGRS